MSRKLNIPDKRKDFLKGKLTAAQKSKLKPDEKLYLSKVEGGRKRQKEAVKIKGQFIKKEVQTLIERFAKNRKMTVDEYTTVAKKEIENFLKNAAVKNTSSRPDYVQDVIKESRKKTIIIEIDGVKKRVPKKEAIKMISEVEQIIKSNTSVVAIGLTLTVFESGKIEIRLPFNPADPDDEDSEDDRDIIERMEDNDLWYIESEPAKKK